MDVSELDDERFTKQIQLRRELVQKLLADGFELWDMADNGTTRFNRAGEMKTLRWNGKSVTYEIV